VALIDLVDGVHRLVAQTRVPSTVDAPWQDIMAGLQHAVEQLSEITGRPLLAPDGELLRPSRPTGGGVDYFALTVSAAEPLQAIVVGLLDEVSVSSARRALATTYAREIERLSLSDARTARQQIDAIRATEPDLILLAGGTNDGLNQRLMHLVETMALGLSLVETDRRPTVVYAGNRRLRDQVAHLLGDMVDLRITDNVRPTLDTEVPYDAAAVIDEIYRAEKIDLIPGIEELPRWGQMPVVPTATALGQTLRYLAALGRGPVLGVDLGSNSATLISATAEQVELAIRTDLGLGRAAEYLPSAVDLTFLGPWLPDDVAAEQVADFALNKSLHPRTIPVDETELQIEQALVRGALRRLIQEARNLWHWNASSRPRPGLLVLRGSSLTRAPRPGQALLMALDGLEPAGFFAAALDQYDILPGIGLLADVAPLVVVQTLESGALYDLGWVVVPTGQAQPGQKVLDVQLRSDTGLQLELEVAFGSIEVLPLAHGEEADVTLTPARRFDVGRGIGRQRTERITGGALGLVIDARGRPIYRPAERAAASSLTQQWRWDIGG
jgi:hypothetical protein